MKVKIGFIISIALLMLGAIFFYQQARFNDQKLHVVFCNVGQGDGIFIRTPKGSDILVDGGPDDSILSCLSNHMPFWDRTVELVILTHPHADHLTGLISVLKRYTVLQFVTEKLNNKTASFKELTNGLNKKYVPLAYLYAGSSFKISDEIKLSILGPTKEFINMTSPQGFIGESGEFSSVITLMTYKDFSVLLTGDSQKEELEDAISLKNPKVDILQIPHHGSKTGLNGEILNKVRPRLAVTSVGRNNKYGHPAKEILKLLEEKGIKALRTDEEGEIEVISDGKVWEAMRVQPQKAEQE